MVSKDFIGIRYWQGQDNFTYYPNGERKRMKTIEKKSDILLGFCRFFLVLIYLLCLGSLPAYALEFISEDEFAAVESAYKDFPLKILFKQLSESDPAKKREIRNMIILKQVFDRNMQEKTKVGAVSYNKTFGVVKDISGDKLRLWIPETESYKDLFVGIDQIPVENKNKYRLTQSGIGKYALVAYTLDDRIYKLEIDYELAVPTLLSVKREGKENLIGWTQPETIKTPSGYKVFVNGKPFASVEDTSIRVPRTEGQIDKYFVKAVYSHGKTTIDSDASESMVDGITAKEFEQKALANQTYDRIIPLLIPTQWENGKKALYENQQFFTDNLDGARKANASGLVDFFKDIDAGDSLSAIEPLTPDNLDKALASYMLAEQKAKALPAEIAVLFITQQKINENSSRKELLAETLAKKGQKDLAEKTYNQIIAGLTPLEWEKAKKLLYDNQQTLTDYLDEARKANTAGLVAFFKDIDGGDHLATQQPETPKNLDLAVSFYQRAEQKAKTFPAGIDPSFIAQLKISDINSRKGSLEKTSQEVLAKETYDKVILALNPSDWESAKTLLYEKQILLTEHLDTELIPNALSFIEFFRDIDGGDRLGGAQPETLRNLESALTFYQRADKKSGGFPPGVDMSFLSQLRINQTADRIAQMEKIRQEAMAAEVARAPQPQLAAVSDTPDPRTLDRKTALRWGVKQFKGKYYISSLSYFERVYSGQIRSIKEGKQLAGLLALPEKLRPVVIFLIEYEKAIVKASNDSAVAIDGILEDIEIAKGLWGGIPETKRNMIVKYVSK